MSRHGAFHPWLLLSNVSTLLLMLCSDIVTLSCNVVTLTWNSIVMCDVSVDVAILVFPVLSTSADVATLEI